MLKKLAVAAVATAALVTVFAQQSNKESDTFSTISPAAPADTAILPAGGEDRATFIARTIENLNPGTADPTCHSKWHTAGQSIGSRGYSFAELAAVENYDGCNWGVVHGFVEGAMDDATLENFKTRASDVCGTDLTERESVGNCLHGTGHASWRVTRGDIQRSLELCDVLTVGQSDCADGVYMSLSEAVERGVWNGDALSICEKTGNAEFKNKCYRYSGHIWSRALDGDPDAMLANCPDGQRECGLGVGRALGYRGKSAAEVIISCRLAEDKAVAEGCAQGVGEWFSLIRRTGQGTGDPTLVCEEMGPELYNEFKDACETGERQQ